MIIICIRDPDASNEFKVFGEPKPYIIDVDLGRADLRDSMEFAEWAESMAADVAQLVRTATPDALKAAQYLAGLVAEVAENYGHTQVPVSFSGS